MKVQGEILEGLVARIVSPDSSKHMGEVLKAFPSAPLEGGSVFYSHFHWINTFPNMHDV